MRKQCLQCTGRYPAELASNRMRHRATYFTPCGARALQRYRSLSCSQFFRNPPDRPAYRVMGLHGQQRFSFTCGQPALRLSLTMNPDRTLLESLGTLTFPVITLPDKRFLTLLLLFRHNAPSL
ncbi:hypothetical protein ALP77_05068 [Pseudomonas amygdali pv. tabaci]|uniref:Uncharacterized protein n=3 Tax=Pseudomonas syringae group genomosp. 2 TaxID=251698 RepID=A0A0P9S4I2_PSEAV|nr:Uncharacterized protein ALO35_05575 [Pseudomonas amygdali pv. lachrymans]KPY81404.1 Uncharacterized protein ALO60_04823 [Pseudomonas amygdali pv. tabaci]RMR90670.1 hypothetical protein ALP77_05068 [Pseudomonas amygdali pv. tabaci]